jgi:hypothetical protein
MQPNPIAGAKASLEVHRSDVIGVTRHRQRWQWQSWSSSGTRTTTYRQSQFAQPATQGGHRRSATSRQEPMQFFGSPIGMLATQLAQPLAPVLRSTPAMPVWRARSRAQTAPSRPLITPPISIAGWTTDVKKTTQSGERMLALRHCPHKLSSPFHRQRTFSCMHDATGCVQYLMSLKCHHM